jgi:hypothetical protein
MVASMQLKIARERQLPLHTQPTSGQGGSQLQTDSGPSTFQIVAAQYLRVEICIPLAVPSGR